MYRSRESAEAAVGFTVKTYGRMDVLVNGAAGNFLANAHELKLKVGLIAAVSARLCCLRRVCGVDLCFWGAIGIICR